jgi:hypothetical protein
MPQQWLSYSTCSSYVLPVADPQLWLQLDRHRLVWTSNLPRQSEWTTLYEDLAVSTAYSFATAPSNEPRQHPSALAGFWTVPLIYKLLKWRPLEESEAEDEKAAMQEALRLGALLYMVPVWRFYGVHPVRSAILLSKLKTLITRTNIDWSIMWNFQLWVLYMGALEAQNPADLKWFGGEMAKVMHEHNVDTGLSGRETLRGISLPDEVFAGRDADATLWREVERLLMSAT